MRFDVAAFAVRNWQFTLVAFALLAMLGLNALMTTPRSEDPHFPIPVVIVRAVLPGAEPAEMEQLVADPIEDALDGLDDVSKIASTSLDGAAIVSVEFDWSVNTERKYDEVVREVNANHDIEVLQFNLGRAIQFPGELDDLLLQQRDQLLVFSS